MRVEKVVKIIQGRVPSDKYPQRGWAFDLKDGDGNDYEWNTVTMPDLSIKSGQTWLVRMTLKETRKLFGHIYTRVERVKFIKRIK